MLRLALILSPSAYELPPGLVGSPVFEVVGSIPAQSPAATLARSLAPLDPEVVLVDLSAATDAAELVEELAKSARKAVFLGFGTRVSEQQTATLERAGLSGILRESFSSSDLEDAVRWALHQAHPAEHPNIIAFLPAKAGCGCSTTVLNTAASLANALNKTTLLIEADRRSGTLSILLDRQPRGGLPRMCAESGKLTSIEWRQHVDAVGKPELLLANPVKPGPQPTWATYFHILNFSRPLYDYILVDLPELVNPATTELVTAARLVFIVCEPELASLKLVQVRRAELEAAGVPSERICVLPNRWESERLTKQALEAITRTPMYAALPNDYQEVKNAAMESRLVSPTSQFGKACATLARRISGARQEAPEGPVATLLRRFAGE